LNIESNREQLLRFNGKINGYPARILLDSGASKNFIDTNFVKKNKLPVKFVQSLKVQLVDGRKKETNKVVNINKLEMNTYKTTGIEAQVINLRQYDIILGKSWLFHANPQINWRTNTLTFRYGKRVINVKADTRQSNDSSSCHSISISQQQHVNTPVNVEFFSIYSDEQKESNDNLEIKDLRKDHNKKLSSNISNIKHQQSDDKTLETLKEFKSVDKEQQVCDKQMESKDLINTQQLEEGYKNDNYFASIWKALKDKDESQDSQSKFYELKDNKIYLHGTNRLAIPKDKILQNTLLLKCHDLPNSEHLGIKETCELLAQKYFWPKMNKDVKRYIKSCNSCHLRIGE
jgi:hypothetical protein